MIISVHMPKTAGSSFRAALKAAFAEGFVPDYADYPLASAVPERHARSLEFGLNAEVADFKGIDCIHGHFLPVKYLLLADQMECRFVTWLREPLARLVSHYYYWQQSYDAAADDTTGLHRRVVEEEWSLERFCLSEELRNVYSAFLWGFPLRYFDFVGITEHYEEDLCDFSTKFLKQSLEPRRDNVSQSEQGGNDLSLSLQRQVLDFHQADVELYQWALRQRRARLERRARQVAFR